MAEGAAADKSFPVRTRQWSAAVEGVDTDFLASGYADWIMLVATQTGTLGTMMQARQDRSLEGGGVTFDVATMVGRRDEPLLTIAARQLAQGVSDAGCDLPLLVCIGMKQHSDAGIRDVIQQMLSHPVW